MFGVCVWAGTWSSLGNVTYHRHIVCPGHKLAVCLSGPNEKRNEEEAREDNKQTKNQLLSHKGSGDVGGI